MAENGIIQEAYCSYETSKLLKEKGFDAPCNSYFVVGENKKNRTKERFSYSSVVADRNSYKSELPDHEYISCPSLAHAMRWLREIHGLFILVGNDDLNWNWQIFDIKNRDENLDPICKSESYGGINFYEEAIEEAIKYCLENLITE